MCAVHIPVQLCMEQVWARSPTCRKRAHISSLPAPTAGVTSSPHCDAFAPFPPISRLPRLGERPQAPRTTRRAPPLLRAALPRTRACPGWGLGAWEAEIPQVTAASERSHGPARPSGVRTGAAPPPRCRPSPPAERGGSWGARTRPPPLRDSKRSETDVGCPLFLPHSLLPESEEQAGPRASGGGVSPSPRARSAAHAPFAASLPPGPPRILPCPLAPRRGGRGPI